MVKIAPTFAISEFEVFNSFNAVFELSAILVSILYPTATLPEYSSTNNCSLLDWISDQLFVAELILFSKLGWHIQRVRHEY